MEQRQRVDLGAVGDRLGQMGESDQQQQDERNGGQQGVEGQSTGEERDVVFISGLERAAKEAGG